MNLLRFASSIALALCLLGALACRRQDGEPYGEGTEPTEPAMTEPAPAESTAPAGRTAEATLASTQPGIGGTVRFAEEPGGGGVRVVADVTGVPAGKHGFHIHEKGDCSAPDYTSAGAHFNPTGAVHACNPTEPRHSGDFGNVEVGPNGTGHMEMTDSNLTFDDPNSIVGKAVVLHAGEDDCKTQPSGNSGDRIACGVIQAGGMAQ